jgi:hypothetical protein
MQSVEYHFNDIPQLPAFGNYTFAEAFDDDTHHLGLFNNGGLISYVRMDFREEPYYQLTSTQTEAAFRNQGCFRYLLMKGLEQHSKILSDDNQSPEARIAWEALLNYPGKMTISLYDKYTKKSQKLINVADAYDNDRYLLLASKMLIPQHIQEQNARNDLKKKSINRDYNSLFYGPSTVYNP